jgi:guanine deaminase
VGDLGIHKAFDAIWLKPRDGSTLAAVLGHAADPSDALAKVFALASPADIARVWVSGDEVASSGGGRTT